MPCANLVTVSWHHPAGITLPVVPLCRPGSSVWSLFSDVQVTEHRLRLTGCTLAQKAGRFKAELRTSSWCSAGCAPLPFVHSELGCLLVLCRRLGRASGTPGCAQPGAYRMLRKLLSPRMFRRPYCSLALQRPMYRRLSCLQANAVL